jgi:hypothetical protein
MLRIFIVFIRGSSEKLLRGRRSIAFLEPVKGRVDNRDTRSNLYTCPPTHVIRGLVCSIRGPETRI